MPKEIIPYRKFIPRERAKAKRWLQKIAHEEVEKYQQPRAFGAYGRFHRRDVREIRRRVIQRVLKDGEERYGFITVGWLLMVVVASCISWAIKKWLDRVFPDRDDKDFTIMLEELSKE